MEKKLTNVAIYVRKSREEEDESTLLRQQKVLTDLCVKNLWKYELFKEVGSSQDLERVQLQEMLNKVKAFHFDAIVVADLDRLSRNTGHFGTIKEILINFGCVVVTPSKVYDFSVQEDDLFSDIQSVLAKNEYQTIKKRLVRGSRQSARDGNWLGKKNPVGYNYNRTTKKLEPTEDAPIIKRLFQEYVDGLSTNDIAFKFTQEGVTTSTHMIWTPSGISRILNNPVYRGDSLYGKTKVVNGKRGVKTNKEDQILIEGTHTAIIDSDTWEKVQELKLSRNSRPIALKIGKRKYSGLIKCALCGRTHSFQKSRGEKQRITSCQTRYYLDDSLENYTVCENKGVNLDTFEAIFIQRLARRVSQLEEYIELIKKSEPSQNDSPLDKIKSVEKQIKKNQQETKRVQQGFIMEIFTEEEAQSQIKILKSQKESLEKELEKLNNISVSSNTDYIESTMNKLKKFLTGHDSLPEVEANSILRDYISSIVYKRIGEGVNAEISIKIVWK